MVYIRKNIKFIFLLVIPIYFFIAQNSILNKHTHFYANGIVVTHSHPVGDKAHGHPINEHHHTKTEICFFHSIHLDVYTLPEETVVKNNTHFERRYFFISNERIESSYTESGSTPRAPPSLLS